MPEGNSSADSQPLPNHAAPISLRAAVIGLLLSAVVSFWGQYAADQLGYDPTFAQLPSCLLLPFFLLVLGPNLILQSFAQRRALTRSELLVIFSMGLIASMVPDRGMTRYLIAVITAPYYFASPENQWAEKFFAYLPDWVVLSNKKGAARGFFEGLPAHQSIPWADWMTPLFWWGSLIAALMFAGACLVIMLRKQWVEHERLQFPLGKVSLHLMGTDQDPHRPGEPAFFRTRMFRIGLGLTLCVMVWNCLSYWELWPHFPIMGPDSINLTIERSFPAIPIRLNLSILCLSFFINAEILFSVWLFILIGILQNGILNRLGFVSTSSTIIPGGLVSIQSIGGMIAFVLLGLWMARRHLREVWLKALGRPSDLQDHNEFFSYRTAVLGLILGLLYTVFWLHHAGLSFSITALFLFFLFVFYLAHARVMAEAGLVMLDLPINAHQFTVGIVGSASLSQSDLTALGLTSAFARNWRTFTMTGLAHVAWLRDHIWPDRRHLFRWICLAFGVSTLTSLLYIISAGYRFGAQNLRTGPGSLGIGFYDLIIQWINNATRVSQLEMIFLLSGVVLLLLMTAGRYLFYWWPLHPIGLLVVASSNTVTAVFPLFLAWLIQVALRRFGGGRLYRKAQPLFVGILVGYVLGQGLSFLVDFIWFPDNPHVFEVW
ncbi:MAG: hypothetical protein HY710_02335 [Candidatus Latescibacteria bacterium]|nr:hypothetical protein [Candidatus Latescibacterota bacterium]